MSNMKKSLVAIIMLLLFPRFCLGDSFNTIEFISFAVLSRFLYNDLGWFFLSFILVFLLRVFIANECLSNNLKKSIKYSILISSLSCLIIYFLLMAGLSGSAFFLLSFFSIFFIELLILMRLYKAITDKKRIKYSFLINVVTAFILTLLIFGNLLLPALVLFYIFLFLIKRIMFRKWLNQDQSKIMSKKIFIASNSLLAITYLYCTCDLLFKIRNPFELVFGFVILFFSVVIYVLFFLFGLKDYRNILMSRIVLFINIVINLFLIFFSSPSLVVFLSLIFLLSNVEFYYVKFRSRNSLLENLK